MQLFRCRMRLTLVISMKLKGHYQEKSLSNEHNHNRSHNTHLLGRILALINDPFLTFLVCVKAIITSGITVYCSTFLFMKILFGAYFCLKFILVRIRIRKFSKVGSRSSGSATQGLMLFKSF
jgi:hypothetical protein